MKISANVKKLLRKLIKDLEASKANDIEILNIKNRSALADFLIIASGTSSRHINSIVTKIIKSNKKSVLATEGLKSTDWLIVDFGDIILNVFKPESRKHYSLEKIWEDIDLKDEKIGFG
ncbi:MAG: ribosome silencing factor [Pseudomonadota bacterium]|nr:ribosome silencing factor [Pseudomonadota bacterium]